MQDLLWQLKELDSFTVYASAVFAAVVFWFVRDIVGDSALAVVSVPLLIAGGSLSPLLFRMQMVRLSYDKDANAIATTAVGVLVALLLILGAKWLWSVFIEHKVRRTKLAPVRPHHRYRR
jgi:hypothetical protein